MENSPFYIKGNKILKLKRDWKEFKDFTILTDGYRVWLSEQKIGEHPKQEIGIPKHFFDKLIKWYLKEQPQAM